jgi:hypothetical protein
MPNVPTDATFSFVSNVSTQTIFIWLYIVIVLLFLGHWLVASYHWYTYGSERKISLLSITVYGAVGGLLLLIIGSLIFAI